MVPSPPRAVLLDLDGCLVDSRVAISRCLNIGLEAVGARARPEHELYRLIGPPLHTNFVELLAEQCLPSDLADRCVEAYRDAYTEIAVTDTVAIEGIADALDQLAGRTTLGVVTSKPAVFARPILEAVGLGAYFAAVHAPGLSARAEPKAVTLARALDDVMPGAPPCASVMVGDRHHDIDAGIACGTAAVGVTWGIGDAAELAHADELVDQPRSLPRTVLP